MKKKRKKKRTDTVWQLRQMSRGGYKKNTYTEEIIIINSEIQYDMILANY